MRSGTVSPRPPSAPLTRATVSTCSLPTPTAQEYGSSQNGINGLGGENERPSANRPSLSTMARTGRLPTPLAADHRSGPNAYGGDRGDGTRSEKLAHAAAALIPTPTASNARQSARRTEERQEGPNLIEWAQRLPTPMAADSGSGSGSYARGNPTLLGALGVKALRKEPPTELARLQARAHLPTPTAKDSVTSGVAGNWTEESGRNPGATLTDVVVRGLDTPTRSLTSPPTSESSSPGSEPPAPSAGTGGARLSPSFVEWMMGWPTEWTSTGPWSSMSPDTGRSESTTPTATPPTTPTASTPAATASSTSELRSPGPSSGTASTPTTDPCPLCGATDHERMTLFGIPVYVCPQAPDVPLLINLSRLTSEAPRSRDLPTDKEE